MLLGNYSVLFWPVNTPILQRFLTANKPLHGMEEAEDSW